jgi:small GTP-binding protein
VEGVNFLTQSDGGAIHILRFSDKSTFQKFSTQHIVRNKTSEFNKLELANLVTDDVMEEVLIIPGQRPELHIHGGISNESALKKLLQMSRIPILENLSPSLSLANHDPSENQVHEPYDWEKKWHEAFLKTMGERAQKYLLDLYPSILNGTFEPELDSKRETENDHHIEGYDYLRPTRLVFLGPPNTGKSTLFNLLVGESRALVSHLSGTTRDLIRATIHLKGWEVEMVDTAGLHPAALEHQAISPELIQGESEKLALQAVKEADIILTFSCELPTDLVSPEKIIKVQTKCDLKSKKSEDGDSIAISSHQHIGIETLMEAITSKIETAKQGKVSRNFCKP